MSLGYGVSPTINSAQFAVTKLLVNLVMRVHFVIVVLKIGTSGMKKEA